MTAAIDELLAANPKLARIVTQFMMLHDAAEVLGELKPPNGDVAAEFLRETGNHIVRDAGIGEGFLQAMITARPPAPWKQR